MPLKSKRYIFLPLALAAYAIVMAVIGYPNFKQSGKCMLCGAPTAAVERKICWECLQKKRDELTVI